VGPNLRDPLLLSDHQCLMSFSDIDDRGLASTKNNQELGACYNNIKYYSLSLGNLVIFVVTLKYLKFCNVFYSLLLFKINLV